MGAALLAAFVVHAGPASADEGCGGGTTASNFLCNLIITYNADGSISTTAPDGATANYDGMDDALIGVINNSGQVLNGFHLSGTGIGGFDGDGIDTFITGAEVAGNPDTTGYGGPIAYFTDNTGDDLDVNFFGGLADGSSTYFSLEGPASLSLNAGPANVVVEPAGVAVFGVGTLGLGLVGRRRSRGWSLSHRTPVPA